MFRTKNDPTRTHGAVAVVALLLVAITPMLTPRPRALAQSLAAERSWFTAGKIKKP